MDSPHGHLVSRLGVHILSYYLVMNVLSLLLIVVALALSQLLLMFIHPDNSRTTSERRQLAKMSIDPNSSNSQLTGSGDFFQILERVNDV